MPQYLYKCVSCQEQNYILHSMSERSYDCPWCGANNTLVKIPAKFNFVKNTGNSSKKVGSVVDNSIQEFKEDLKQEKKSMKEEFHKSSDD